MPISWYHVALTMDMGCPPGALAAAGEPAPGPQPRKDVND